jgi:multisubunit Na+/H+ antiporter MnhG subunit
VSAAAIVESVLLAAAALLTLVCAVGVLVMPDPFQKLHYLAPPAAFASFLVAAAVFVRGNATGGIKAVLAALVLLAINAAVTHATARAARIRDAGQLAPTGDEEILVVGTPEAIWHARGFEEKR